MTQMTEAVRSVLIPVSGMNLLLPNAAVAEIVNYAAPVPVTDTPAWLLGELAWRGRTVPVISFEALSQRTPTPVSKSCRIAVCNTISGRRRLGFIAIMASEIPRLVRIDSDTIGAGTVDAASLPGVLTFVNLDGGDAIIPDLDGLEAMCVELLAA